MANESSNMRPQPPSIKDPQEGDIKLRRWGDEDMDDSKGVQEEADPEETDVDTSQEEPNWERRAKDALKFSTSFVDSNYRQQWEDSIRAFNSQHPGDSKYNNEIFRKRSNIFVPKTRAIIRKNEAAAAAAFFSNIDRVSITAVNQSDPKNRISAQIMDGLIQYRLTKSIPWFQILMGGIQDGQTVGAAIAHSYWKYSTRKNPKGEIIKAQDKPQIDLIPIENFRFDPSADWTDVVGTSPYLIHLIPMFVVDVKQRMAYPDPKGRQWKTYSDGELMVMPDAEDSTRRQRQTVGRDPTKENRNVSDYEVCWINRHIHRWNGTDFEFYTLASGKLLTTPEPLENVVFHGERPYTFGVVLIETHKPMPTSVPALVKGLQDEINEIKNSRLDNVKFVLNKGYFVKRGKNVDIPALVRNVPGRIALMDDPENDVVVNEFDDVTASSYQEEDRNNANFDELVGNFSAASVSTARNPKAPAREMTLLQAPATVLTEYMLKTFNETFVTPLLRKLVLLEQYYETDPVVLGIAGKKSKLFQKAGLDKITDDLLEMELAVNVNVGMGSTDPVMKLQKFLMGVESYAKISVKPPPGMNLGEVWKEIAALTGYQDGERFTLGENPEMAAMQQQMKALQMKLQQLMIQKNNKEGANAARIHSAQITTEGGIKKELIKSGHARLMTFADHIKDLHMAEIQGGIASEAADQAAKHTAEQAKNDQSQNA